MSKTDPGDAVLEGKPLIDEFGQYTHVEWAGKAHSLDDLKKTWTAEETALRNAPARRCPYGGFLETKVKATGFFRVEQIDGCWWFVCPDGHLDTINSAVRKSDTNHLNLGIRFGGSPRTEVLQAARGFDVFSVNIYRDAPDRETFDRIYGLVKRRTRSSRPSDS